MKLINPKHYYSDETFKNEAEKIFSTQWLFACLTIDVAAARDYMVIDYMGKSVIIYNNGKEIKAFRNVCPHRFNVIFNSPKGNDRLVCKYHLWGFDENGGLLGQSEKKLLSDNEQELICLKTYPVSIVGKFIFIHLGDTVQTTLAEQIGAFREDLLLVSEVLGEKLAERDVEHKANWKFIAENIIELQHCKALHQKSLAKAGFCSIPPEEQVQIGHNSSFTIPPEMDSARVKKDKILQKYLPRKLNTNKYKHILFFPNFALTIFEGVTIGLNQLFPLSPDVTNFKLQFYHTQLETDDHVSLEILDEMKPATIDFSFQVFDEDKAALERVQIGVKQMTHSGYMYQSEKRLQWFTESYHQFIN